MIARHLTLVVLAATFCLTEQDPAYSNEADPGISIEIDAQSKGEPISPMLFGHNLEVTRRSIFGGLSAEMVSNRKFAALENGLPKRWQPISDATHWRMDDQMPYANRASLLVESDGRGGLFQQVDAPLFPKGSWTKSMLQDDYGSDVGGLLAFQKGRKYTYRWQIKTTETDKTIWMRLTGPSSESDIFTTETIAKAGDWLTWTGIFTAAETVENARLEIGSRTDGKFWIGAASIQPCDAFHGMRRDVIELLREIKPGALRFPGGCYSDFYNWRDGLLPVDERPVISQGALEFLFTDSDGYDTQELNTDDFIALCRELQCEPAITVRLWNIPGEPEEAAAWVEYCNSGAETHWGKERIHRLGNEKSYHVKTWFVGNELAFFGRNGMNTPAVSAARSRLFAEAMKKADPSIALVGCTDFTKDGSDEWNKGLLRQAGAFLTYGSYHNYAGGETENPSPAAMAKASIPLGKACQTLSGNIQREVTLDEWNTNWGSKGTVAMALHTASTLNMLCRDGGELGISQAYYFQPINEGGIIATPTGARLDAAGKVFALFNAHQGSNLLKATGEPGDDVDVCASLAPSGEAIHVTAVNRSCEAEKELSIRLKNFAAGNQAEVTMLIPNSFDPRETVLAERSERAQSDEQHLWRISMPPGGIARIIIKQPQE